MTNDHVKTNYSVWNSQSSADSTNTATTGELMEINLMGIDRKELWQQLPGNDGGIGGGNIDGGANSEELPSTLHSSAIMNGLRKALQLMEQLVKGAAPAIVNGGVEMDIGSMEEKKKPISNLFGKKNRQEDIQLKSDSVLDMNDKYKKNIDQKLPVPLRWFVPQNHKKKEDLEETEDSAMEDQNAFILVLQKFIDPTIVLYIWSMMKGGNGITDGENNGLCPVTNTIDKILTSTPPLLTIANLLLAVTYLLHSAVPDFFLSDQNGGFPTYH